MEPEEYPKMRRLEDTCWWFVGRRAKVLDYISALVGIQFDPTVVREFLCILDCRRRERSGPSATFGC